MFIGETWRDLNIKKRDLELTCVRRDRSGRASTSRLTVPPQGRADWLGARFW